MNSTGVYWPAGDRNGSFFGHRYGYTRDPQCSDPTVVAQVPGFNNLCTLQAITDTQNDGQIVLQNPLPGNKGNMGFYQFRNLARWNVDMSMSKMVTLTETMSFRLRADFTNIFNHPFASGTPGASGTRITFPTAPQMSINGATELGLYDYKVGTRTFQLMARFDF